MNYSKEIKDLESSYVIHLSNNVSNMNHFISKDKNRNTGKMFNKSLINNLTQSEFVIRF